MNKDFFSVVILNIFLMAIYNSLILFLCRNLGVSFFDPNKKLYKIKSWEKNGNFYIKFLKIKKWKDRLPQYIAKGGFSKKNLRKNLNKEYISRFIVETCIAEWNHLMCCTYFVIAFLVNTRFYAIIFSVLAIVLNVPFLFIQRYNRIRLYKLLNRDFNYKILK